MIYPALALLADEGLIAEQDSEDQRRKFAITDGGHQRARSARKARPNGRWSG